MSTQESVGSSPAIGTNLKVIIMETNFNFESAICTSREQSERLLALGINPVTADCMIITKSNYVKHEPRVVIGYDNVLANTSGFEVVPAWSLGRLIKDLMPQRFGYLELAVGNDYVGYYKDEYDGMEWKYSSETSDMFDNIISTIEWLIKEGYFNKEYLEE